MIIQQLKDGDVVYCSCENGKYMLKDEIELLKMKPIELNIWDSLAELT